MSFHLGKPILVISVVAVVSGAAIALRPAPAKPDLVACIFDDSHYKSFEPLIP